MRVVKKYDYILAIINSELFEYPTPSNLNYNWSFGSLAGLVLVSQIVTGILLVMHYTPHVSLAFSSLEHILRDVNAGWLIRYTHSNGASFFFIVLYLHLARNFFFKSYAGDTKAVLWFSGVFLFLLVMGTGFLGYVLPWGQMSFWGATVITNLASAIPFIGENVAYWLWGGFSVDNATLNRFFSLHYLLPFLIVGLVLLHLAALHHKGSSNPLKIYAGFDKVAFYPYFVIKDIFGALLLLSVFFYFIFFLPNYLGHPDNYIKANPLVTPPHIVPEWYFLPFYAILRTVPSKLGGVVLMVLAILIWLVLPFYPTTVLTPRYCTLSSLLFWTWVLSFMLLMWLGGQVVEEPYTQLASWATIFYFVNLFVLGLHSCILSYRYDILSVLDLHTWDNVCSTRNKK